MTEVSFTLKKSRFPSWIKFPVIDNNCKKWANGNTILVNKDNKTILSLVVFNESDNLLYVRIPGCQNDVLFSWESIYCGIKYQFILDYTKDTVV